MLLFVRSRDAGLTTGSRVDNRIHFDQQDDLRSFECRCNKVDEQGKSRPWA